MSSQKDSCSGFVSRREFLRLTGASIVVLTLPPTLQKVGTAVHLHAQQVEYPRQIIAKFSDIEPGVPITFQYPWEHPLSTNTLIQLSEEAGGGIGPDRNTIAFNNVCPHQGGPLGGLFHPDVSVAGPCPLHWTTFDITRHGMVISGHATQGLPQIILELEGDDIVATGVQGLIFGYYNNRVNPTT